VKKKKNFSISIKNTTASMTTSTVRLGPQVPPPLPRDYVLRSGRFHDWECEACGTYNAVYLVACRECGVDGTVRCRWQG